MSSEVSVFKAPIQFNQNGSYVAVTEQDNLIIYNINPFGKIFELQGSTTGLYKTIDLTSANGVLSREEIGGVLTGRYLIEMLFSTSLIAVVDTIQQPKKLNIINTKRKSAICELKFDHNVQQICLNRKRLVVLLQSKQIFIYDISCMQLLHTIDVMEDSVIKKLVWKQQQKSWINKNFPIGGSTTSSTQSQTGEDDAYSYEVKMSLSFDDNSVLAYTTYSLNSEEHMNETVTTEVNNEETSLHNTQSSTDNDVKKSKIVLNNVVVFDAINLKQINFIPRVHNTNVRCLTLSHDGSVLVTASTRGTIIRCFKTNGLTCYKEFRRGNRPCVITQLVIDQKLKYLACVGNTDTIHIFEMNDGLSGGNRSGSSTRNAAFKNESKYAKVSKFLSSNIVNHIPRQSLERNIAHIKKTNEKELAIIGFSLDTNGQIYVSYGDRLEVYDFSESLGECILKQTHKF